MSVVDTTNCEFAKTFSYLLFTARHSSRKKPTKNCKEYESRILHDQCKSFLSQFQDYPKTVESLPKIVKLGKNYLEKKTMISGTFFSDNCDKLNEKKNSFFI